MASKPVALITGASSGIGLALTKNLLSKGWNVALLDLQQPPSDANLDPNSSTYIKCDVSSWESQASAFNQVFDKYGRLDFAALNAGIDDKDDVFRAAVLDLKECPDRPPRKPNMLTFDVDLLAVYYGIKLFTYYYLRNSKGLGGRKTGCVVATSSVAGLKSHPAVPQYTAAKRAVVGLVQSLAPTSLPVANIRINAICPAFVPTNLAPGNMVEKAPKEMITPMSTIMRAYERLLDEEAEGGGRNGICVEGNLENLVDHGPETEEEAKGILGELFAEVYKDRNVMFARQ